jgi:hypothetical protein
LSPGSTARQLGPTWPRQCPTVPTVPTCPDSTLPQKLDSDHACVLSSTVKLSSTLPTARQPDSPTVRARQCLIVLYAGWRHQSDFMRNPHQRVYWDRRGGVGTWRMSPPGVRQANVHQTASNCFVAQVHSCGIIFRFRVKIPSPRGLPERGGRLDLF